MADQPQHNHTGASSTAADTQEAKTVVAFGRAGSSVLQALAADLPEVPHIQLHEPDSSASGIVPPGSEPMSAAVPAGRYQLLGEIARGGMGCVLRGRDADLGRDVAVKVLLEKHIGRTELLRRFVEEAQIAGQLQHPGIVPVYEMGQLPDKRPYFSMKLVKGQTLARLLTERGSSEPLVQGEEDRRAVCPAAADRPQLLEVFAQVCQAVAYAHARGVIHRDLKPSNVMVGDFGEVLVLDWGVAKLLPRGAVADEAGARQEPPAGEAPTEVRSGGNGNSTAVKSGSQTEAGSVIGTPAYMAPEQARAELHRVDERADVFGLGAI